MDANKVFSYLFWLSVILIFAAYFVGVSTDASVFGRVINSLGNTFTGRNAQGQFAPYPTGGGTAP